MCRYRNYRFVGLIVLICWLIFVIFGYSNPHTLLKLTNDSIQCYRYYNNATLPDISEITPRSGKSIFFHETSCRSFEKGKITITARQACAVESAALLNPELDVYLLYSSPGVFAFEGDESDNFLKILQELKNIKIMHLNVERYLRGTPVEKLYSDGRIENSSYVVSHTSDVLRFLTLWKYGGIYLDLDMVVTKPLGDLSLNFAGLESRDLVGSAILSFSPDGIGHKLAGNCLQELKTGFDGKEWGHNGPQLITRVLNENCNVNLAEKMLNKDCNGMTIYPEFKFFPVPYKQWRSYFQEDKLDDIIGISQQSYAVHIWNKLSNDYKIPLTSNSPYFYFAKKYCPRIVEACNEHF